MEEAGPLAPQHRHNLIEVADASVHLHCLVETIGMGGGVAAPTALTHHDGVEVEVERLAHAGLDATIGGTAANDDGVAPKHAQQFGDTSSVERAGTTFEEDIVRG